MSRFTLIKEDVYECLTCISAQRGGQSAFLHAHHGLVYCSPLVIFWFLLRAAPSTQAVRGSERSFIEQGGDQMSVRGDVVNELKG